MDFSPASLFAGFVFGVLGVAFIKRGRNQAQPPLVLLGLSLCVFPYFVSSVLLQWIIGAVIVGVASRLW